MNKITQTKLIILRGPSGSGKSTVGKQIFETTTRKTCLIEQDHYRFIFKPPGGGTKPNIDTIHQMIKHNVLQALSDGYDVILEGILSVGSYSEVLEQILHKHPAENYMFYFDIRFEETLKRHATKPLNNEFGRKEMREWYPAAHRSNHKLEQIIPETFSIKQTVAFIKQSAGLDS